ncbi:permease prefix domain 1-containing protein [Arthrobacter sp. B0490]|uniref:permease prefix domain 1-containing protein n=1 Tax=Arthrobacter sp. B0490 TaxID=2058891 RepID=UPI000CE49DFD|nr:permease prefix domain 1-containing protein [Arthrobacter sp. B0490]
MTTLTDRYVWAAVRTVPEPQRSDLEPEIRELIEETVQARRVSGEEPVAAERAALVQLGDPERLAADYADRPLTLIGPRYYLEWLRLLKTLLAVVVPIVTVVVFLAQFLSRGDPGAAIGSAVATALGVTVHLGFWTTLVFVLLERAGTADTGIQWSPEGLPALPDHSRHARLPEFVASLVFLAALAAAIVWQHVSSVVRGPDGRAIALLDPALWAFWLPWFLVLLLAEAAFAAWVYLRDWSWAAAAMNLVLNLAFAVPAVLLWSGGRLLNPDFVAAVGWDPAVATGGGWTVASIVTGAVVLVAAWDVVDGFLRARRASLPATRQPVLMGH